MSKKDDDGRFREVDEDRFDDISNRYFPFSADDDDGGEDFPFAPDMENFMMEFTDMVSGLFDEFISLLPEDVQEHAHAVLDALMSSGSGKPKEALRIISSLKKKSKERCCPGLSRLEARCYRLLAREAIAKSDEEAAVYLRKERKALSQYIKECDQSDDCDFDAYLEARSQRARISALLGETKGVLLATVEIPEDRDFDIDEVLDAIDVYYESPDPVDCTDTSYVFCTDGDSVISIEYVDPSMMMAELRAFGSEELRKQVDEIDDGSVKRSSVAITVEAGKSITSAAFDMQQVLAAVCSCYRESPLVALNNTVLPPPFIELLLTDTSDGLVCEPVIYQIFYAEGDDSILRTHAGAVWGRRNIGIVAEKGGDPSANLIPLIAAFSKNIRHPMKDGDDFEADGRKFRMTDAKDGDEDILLMKER